MDYCVDMESLPTDRKVIIDYHANKELQRTKFEAIKDAFFIKVSPNHDPPTGPEQNTKL